MAPGAFSECSGFRTLGPSETTRQSPDLSCTGDVRGRLLEFRALAELSERRPGFEPATPSLGMSCEVGPAQTGSGWPRAPLHFRLAMEAQESQQRELRGVMAW